MEQVSDELRRCEILTSGKEFVKGEFRDLKKGMIFQMFEPDSTPCLDSDGNSIFIAESDAYEKDFNPALEYLGQPHEPDIRWTINMLGLNLKSEVDQFAKDCKKFLSWLREKKQIALCAEGTYGGTFSQVWSPMKEDLADLLTEFQQSPEYVEGF